MNNLHRTSGIVVAFFIAIHLFTHCMAIFGVETHQWWLDSFRRIYHIPLIEVLLITFFSFQVGSGFYLFAKHYRDTNATRLTKLKRYSGLILSLFLLQHIPATIGQRLYLEIDTNFYFAARVVNEAPFLYYFIPYYFIGLMALGIHIASIHKEKISPILDQQQAMWHFRLIIGVFLVIAILVLLVLTGSFYTIVIPSEYYVY